MIAAITGGVRRDGFRGRGRLALLAFAMAAGAAACRGPGPRSAPRRSMERMFFFAERDERGHEHPISARPPAATPVDGGGGEAGTPPADARTPVASLADGASIDVNSKLLIELRQDALGDTLDEEALAGLEAQATALRGALEQIADYHQARARAAAAWTRYELLEPDQREGSPELLEFREARQERGRATLQLLGPIRELWPRQSEELAEARARVEGLVDRLQAGEAEAVVEMNALLQERLRGWKGEAELVEDEATRALDQRRLRIEAILRPRAPDVEPQQVHVRYYDTLDEGRVRRIDPSGLLLSEEERARLRRLMEASVELAEVLERIRTGNATAEEAFEGARSALVRRFAELGRIVEKLDAQALDQRAETTQAALRSFLDVLGRELPQVAEERAGEWSDQLAAVLDARQELLGIVSLAADLEALEARWRAFDRTQVAGLLADSAAAVARIGELLDADALRTAIVELRGELDNLLEFGLAGLSEDVQERVREPARRLLADLAGWTSLAREARSVLEALEGLLGLSKAELPHLLEVEAEASFSVPLATAPDTLIDLRATPRRPGDSLHLRMLVVDRQGAKVDGLETTFRLEQLGWHSQYVPSVVFVTADEVAGATDTGGFSAALSWQWSYGARDDEGDPWLSRALGWSAGLHAAAISFAPDNDSEIGLGLTIGLWDDRLILGAGYNLFADSRDDGRYYYFVGSSLIPLLQALQGDD